MEMKQDFVAGLTRINRRTYPWGREDMELIRFHKDMIRIHKNYEALIRGSVMFLHGAHKITHMDGSQIRSNWL